MTNKNSTVRRLAAGLLAVNMLLLTFLPYISSLSAEASTFPIGSTVLSYGEGFSHYCIDGHEYVGEQGGVLDAGETYTYIRPSERLTSDEMAIVYWAMLGFWGGHGGDPQSAEVFQKLKALHGIREVSANDLKGVIHSSAVLNRNSWIKTAVQNADIWLAEAGLIGGGSGGTGKGGKTVPSALSGHYSAATAIQMTGGDGSYTLDLGDGGADFLSSGVKLMYSETGAEPFSAGLPSGWSVNKSGNSLTFTGSGSLFVKLDPTGTAYESSGGSFASAMDVYDNCLELWVCTKCVGVHKSHPSPTPLEWHQRLVSMHHSGGSPATYFASTTCGSSGGGGGGETSMNFVTYFHEEEWTSHYNLQLTKYDHETGKTLEGAKFNVYEKFNDTSKISDDEGPVQLYRDNFDGSDSRTSFEKVGGVTTDTSGYAAYTQTHQYHYKKTFCDGHPAPTFTEVPSPEEDEETGEVMNESEIEAAQQQNMEAAQVWLDTVAACEAYESDGTHFHWIMDGVDEGEINSIASSGGSEGETPDAGETSSASGDESYESSGCQADCEDTYDKFVSLNYTYAFKETEPRYGYILHDTHNDDIPIEAIKTNSSEGGAKSSFAGHGKNVLSGIMTMSLPLKAAASAPAFMTYAEDKEEPAEPVVLSQGVYEQELKPAYGSPSDATYELKTEEEEETILPDGEISNDVGTGEEKNLIDRIIDGIGSIFAPIEAYAAETKTNEPETASETIDETEKADDVTADQVSEMASDKSIEEGKTEHNDAQPGDCMTILSVEDGAVKAMSMTEESTISQTVPELTLAFAPKMLTAPMLLGSSGGGSEIFDAAIAIPTEAGTPVTQGPDDKFSHCDDRDGEGNMWRIYDHRTEGDIHINKRDMELKAGESAEYSSYGQSQGDATLEGAVYGLFAADNIVHPDGKTGTVYEKNDLVAVATTDKNGDASFLAYTVRPHSRYDYDAGRIECYDTSEKQNLYDADKTIDDYKDNGTYTTKTGMKERTYYDYETGNGSCWIGRPLILGDYYVKELTRAEGMELSIGNRMNPLSNIGQDPDVGVADAEGYASVTGVLSPQEQIPGTHIYKADPDYEKPDYDELTFRAISGQTATRGAYDLGFSGIPEGSKVYRLDTGTVLTEITVGTGVYEEKYVLEDGHKVQVTAQTDTQYIKYDGSGNPIETIHTINDKVSSLPIVSGSGLDSAKVNTYLTKELAGMSKPQVEAALADTFSIAIYGAFAKVKTELVLRANGKSSPKESGEYSSLAKLIYDNGDVLGDTYGQATQVISIPRLAGGMPIKTADFIGSVLDYYNTHTYFNFGGIADISVDGDDYHVTVYASAKGLDRGFYTYDTGEDAVFIPIPHDGSTDETKRYVYAVYSADGSDLSDGTPAFGSFDDESIGTTFSGTLITKAEAKASDYTLSSVLVKETEYYATGEPVFDSHGNPVYKTEFVEKTKKETKTVEEKKWKYIGVLSGTEPYVLTVPSTYTDAYGNAHTDSAKEQEYKYLITLPSASSDMTVTLTEDDIKALGTGSGWSVGNKMSVAQYYASVRHASVKAYPDYASMAVSGADSYVKAQSLIYPGKDYTFQDGSTTPGEGTRKTPVAVEERVIKQTIKVTKDIEQKSYNNTNSFASLISDWWTNLFGNHAGKGSSDSAARKVSDFRFKTYLKSDIQNIFRDEDGNIIWQDRTGREYDQAGILDRKADYPALSQRKYTKVKHETGSLYKDSYDAVIANDRLYDYAGGYISETQNSGYTHVLETVTVTVEDGTGIRYIDSFNTDKFFEAIIVANNDKWDDASPTYTSYKPIANKASRTGAQVENARVSDLVRQFAIDWYLDDEVDKLTQDTALGESEAKAGKTAYPDALYDEALSNAIRKANNYLKPFFKYDLDEIYAIEWDPEAGGGADADKTTLNASKLFGGSDNASEGYYYGVSAYLPYGTYYVVEQLPKYAGSEYGVNLLDFKNKHYEIDRPKEVSLPMIYSDYAGSQGSPEVMNGYYNYDKDRSQEESERKFKIRFNEEVLIQNANSNAGAFELFPYGLEVDKVTNGTVCSAGNYYGLTQGEYKPLKNYYNAADDRTASNVTYYLTEGKSGREDISRTYRYSSLAEDGGTADDVAYDGGIKTTDNMPGIYYKDGVHTMTGMQTAYDGKYASMLVPWTICAPESDSAEQTDAINKASGESTYRAFAYTKMRNTLYTAKIRLEKLDSETHENILHDDAIFAIYAAQREDSEDGNGRVKFYTSDAVITGSKEFIEAMCGTDGSEPIDPDDIYGTYKGTVKAGTPICFEEDRVILGDSYGKRTVEFKSYSTMADMEMSDAGGTALRYGSQNVGYVVTPQPLSAGAYVIVEETAPAGYVRTRPLAIEIYSDKITYYKEGNKDERVMAAVYEDSADNTTTNKNKPNDKVNVAKVNIENDPIKLKVEKVKESSITTAETTADKTVTYKVSGRVDGPLSEIGMRDDLIYAYEGGQYRGWAYYKGTLEYLNERKTAGEDVDIVFDGSLFAGYGFITRKLETADDGNEYIEGATLTLFDAIELTPTGGSGDHAYKGLTIDRESVNSNVKRMYVKEGYAGEKIEFAMEADSDGTPKTTTYQAGVDSKGDPIMATGNIWAGITIKRPDTDILFYALDNLELTFTENVDGVNILYGLDEDYKKVPLSRIESDKASYDRTDIGHSIYAYKDGLKYLEFTGGDFTEVSYDKINKLIHVGTGTEVYHLDEDGNRDSRVDPLTGMAYNIEEYDEGGITRERILVWPVNVRTNGSGLVTAREKITTHRVATVGENVDAGKDAFTSIAAADDPAGSAVSKTAATYEHTESGSITGSWTDAGTGESNQETSSRTNKAGNNWNKYVLIADDNGEMLHEVRPIYDGHGNIRYYQVSGETYDKGTDIYDVDNDFMRYQDSTGLEKYNTNAYLMNEPAELYDGKTFEEGQTQNRLFHRYGEGYILQNTWISGDSTPNDPFATERTDGQADIIKRIPYGNYILEEIKTPSRDSSGKSSGGYVKAFPVGITVDETRDLQTAKMVDKTNKIEISKVDAASGYTVRVIDMDNGGVNSGTAEDGITSYSYAIVPGATLTLYKAKRNYDVDITKYPKGYRLEKADTSPVTYAESSDRVSSPRFKTAQWITDGTPIYIEHLTPGLYMLEETVTPKDKGFITSEPMEIEVADTGKVRIITMPEDHTKAEVRKYYVDDITGDEVQLKGARLSLYEAKTDASGNVIYDADGEPECLGSEITSWISSNEDEYRDFMDKFEQMYSDYGTKGTGLSYVDDSGITHTATVTSVAKLDQALAGGTTTDYPSRALVILSTDDGRTIRVSAYGGKMEGTVRRFSFDYQFDYKTLPSVNGYADSYTTIRGTRRFNHLPVDGKYVIKEVVAPAGFAKAKGKVIGPIKESTDIQAYSIEDQQSQLLISKVLEGITGEYEGAKLALYRADASGNLIKDDAHFVARWKTGMDGRYTFLDKLRGVIPSGYSEGDLRPHSIKNIPSGTYYVVEEECPEYYTLAEPMKIEYTVGDVIKVWRVTNMPVKGRLEIKKTDEGGNPLTGAAYLLSTYRQGNKATPIKTQVLSSSTVTVIVEDLPVGEMDSAGKITPYVYTLKEIMPPVGYAVTKMVYRWEFTPRNGSVCYSFGEKAEKAITVTDSPTEIRISKRDLNAAGTDDSDGAFITGAGLKLYEVTGMTLDDEPIYDAAHPVKSWITNLTDKEIVIKGLVAAHTYLLIEDTVPSGTNKMEPVMFTLSSDGRKMETISNKLSSFTANYIDPGSYVLDTDTIDTDAIESVTLKGRYAVLVTNVITDKDGNIFESWPAEAGEHVINKAAGYTDGEAYTIREITRYSDGSERVTRSISRTFLFDGEGRCTYDSRTVQKVELSLRHADGTRIDSFSPVNGAQEKTIDNSVSSDNLVITMHNASGDTGEVLKKDAKIINKVEFFNTYHQTVDAVVKLTVDAGTEIVNGNGGVVSGNTITYTIPDLSPYEVSCLTFETVAHWDSTSVTAVGTFGKKTVTSSKTVPTGTKGMLTVYNELTGSGKEEYASEKSSFRIRLYNNAVSPREELLGTYSYSGSKSGTLMSGDVVTLRGNEFICIDLDVYTNVHYTVERIEDGKAFTERYTEGDFTSSSFVQALFSRKVMSAYERKLFAQGETYIIEEETEFTDGTKEVTNKLSVTIDGKGVLTKISALDSRTNVSISKCDITGTNEIPGCSMILRDSLGAEIDSWVSGLKPHLMTGVLEPGKTYTLIETSPAPGYAYAEQVRFTVNSDGTVDKVTMIDTKTKASFSKGDYAGNEVPGAAMKLYEYVPGGADKLIASWTSETEPYAIEGRLEAEKSYIYHEEIAPAGYVVAEFDILFSLNRYGDVVNARYVDKDMNTILYDKANRPTGVVIRETGGIKHYYQGAEEVFISSGNVVRADGAILFTGVKEYIAVIDNHLVINDEKKPDPPSPPPSGDDIKIIFYKYDYTTSKALKGAEFTVYYADKKTPVGSITTDESGYASMYLPASAVYYYRETKTPEGYYADESLKEVSLVSVNRITVKVPNTPYPPVIITKKDTVTKETIAGVTFEIYDEEDVCVFEATTGEDGTITFLAPHYGTYTVRETKVPEGYEISEETICFTVAETGITGTTTFFNIKTEDLKKKGKLIPSYTPSSYRSGRGYFDSDGKWHSYPNPYAQSFGDGFPLEELLLMLVICIICAVTAGAMIRRKEAGEDD